MKGSRSKRLKRKKIVARRAPKAAARPTFKVQRIVEDPKQKLARRQYESALELLNHHKFERALNLFEKAIEGATPELAERARVHVNICRQRLDRKAPALKSTEDHYNFAIAQINLGNLADAEEHLQKGLKQSPKAGH